MFAVVEVVSDELSMGEPHPVHVDSAAVLVGLSLAVVEPAALIELWRKASVFGVVRRWIEALADEQRRDLADALSALLTSFACDLDWQTDVSLRAFAEGGRYARKLLEFPNRLDEVRHAKRVLQQTRRALAPKDVFADMAAAVVLAGNGSQIGNLLQKLPPGQAYFCALETVRRYRPSVVAMLLWHPSFATDGMAATLDWDDRLAVAHDGYMALHDEWLEVMRTARRLALFNDAEPNYDAAIALGVYDEAHDRPPSHDPNGRSPTLSAKERIDLWRERLASPGQVARACDAIILRMRAQTDDMDLVFALRLLSIIGVSDPDQAARLAKSVVDAYVARFSLERQGNPPCLSPNGVLLAVLDRTIRSRIPEDIERWIRPFPVEAFVERARQCADSEILSAPPMPQFAVPRFVSAHARNMLAAADADARSAALVEATVELFELTNGKMEDDAWSGELPSLGEEPLLPHLGRALRQVDRDSGTVLVERVVASGATPLQLVQILAGIERGSHLVGTLELRARRAAEAMLTSPRLTLGEADAFSASLFHAGMPHLAEQFASLTLAAIKNHPPQYSDEPVSRAVRALLASWAAQGKWDDVENAQLPVNDHDGLILIENLRAIAELERGKVSPAIERLARILERRPNDPMALTNLAAAHAAFNDWDACLACCETARRTLKAAMPAEVDGLEARAHYNMKNFRRAVEAIERLPADHARKPEIVSLRVALATETSPSVAGLRDDLNELAKFDRATANALQAKLAPLSDAEIGGAWFVGPGFDRKFSTFEERCAAFAADDTPEMILVTAIASALQRIAEMPALAVTLDEDQLTRLLCLLIKLDRLRVVAEVFVPGGWSHKKEGLADFALTEASDRGITYGRRLVRGEAKLWKGAAWMTEGLKQVLGTANTGQELFLCLTLYSNLRQFEEAVRGARETLHAFGSDAQAPFVRAGEPEELALPAGSAVRALRCGYRAGAAEEAATRIVIVFVVDIASTLSLEIRDHN